VCVCFSTMAAVDVTTLIGHFVADPVETSLVLPHMTTSQRKAAKQFLEEFPELRCESYGFGAERQMHLFKNCADQPRSASPVLAKRCDLPCLPVSVKNTFIDGWVASEPEPILFRSLPLRSDRRSLDFASIVQMSSQGKMEIVSPTSFSSLRKAIAKAPWQHRRPATSDRLVDGKASTVSERHAAFDSELEPDVTQEEVHLKAKSIDDGMFRQCVLAESSEGALDYSYTPTSMGYDSPRTASESEPEEVCSLVEAQAGNSSLAEDGDWLPLILGSLVVVEGLLQAPAFNGRSAVVQGWDQAIGRYCILFADQDGCQQAKLKPENLRMVLPPLE